MRRRLSVVIIFIGLAALGLHGQCAAAGPRRPVPPTFKVEVNYVEIDAR